MVLVYFTAHEVVPSSAHNSNMRDAEQLIRTLDIIRIREKAVPGGVWGTDGYYVLEIEYASIMVGATVVFVS